MRVACARGRPLLPHTHTHARTRTCTHAHTTHSHFPVRSNASCRRACTAYHPLPRTHARTRTRTHAQTHTQALERIVSARLHRMYVVDADVRPIGVVTLTDLLRETMEAAK